MVPHDERLAVDLHGVEAVAEGEHVDGHLLALTHVQARHVPVHVTVDVVKL